ncbi:MULTISPECIES: acyl-CoA carboxylase subunit epsilon [unclassified Streptomyces]|uniref:acyl-CoA carboxylase subunit epsilon n=1 Tax=unclassified Streptomyces TaxID=2593676 RepID=UPI001447869E|nr:acyl-CoA carboxylase subunit epsilon [Streptomyces sp. A1136]
MIRRIKVVRGRPDHIELAALTAALVVLARSAPAVPEHHHGHGHHRRRAHWDRHWPLVHPAHSWRARPPLHPAGRETT